MTQAKVIWVDGTTTEKIPPNCSVGMPVERFFFLTSSWYGTDSAICGSTSVKQDVLCVWGSFGDHISKQCSFVAFASVSDSRFWPQATDLIFLHQRLWLGLLSQNRPLTSQVAFGHDSNRSFKKDKIFESGLGYRTRNC